MQKKACINTPWLTGVINSKYLWSRPLKEYDRGKWLPLSAYQHPVTWLRSADGFFGLLGCAKMLYVPHNSSIEK